MKTPSLFAFKRELDELHKRYFGEARELMVAEGRSQDEIDYVEALFLQEHRSTLHEAVGLISEIERLKAEKDAA